MLKQNCSCNSFAWLHKYTSYFIMHIIFITSLKVKCLRRDPVIYFTKEFTRQINFVLRLKSSITKWMYYLFSLHLRRHKDYHKKPMMLPTAQHQVRNLQLIRRWSLYQKIVVCRSYTSMELTIFLSHVFFKWLCQTWINLPWVIQGQQSWFRILYNSQMTIQCKRATFLIGHWQPAQIVFW